MNKNSNPIHPLLLRQMKRCGMDEDVDLSKMSEPWQLLLKNISRAYKNHDQDLYLLERSMTLSSDELVDLNQKLELAQKIAHLGYWRFEKKTKQMTWSKEMYALTGFNILEGTPKWCEVTQQMIKEDAAKLNELFQKAFDEGKAFSLEIPYILKQNGQKVWHYIKGQPEITDDENFNEKPIQFLSGIIFDITDRKISEQKLEKSRQQMVSISRQAGMAEVAMSILHNIGNVLNSANVSISILKENKIQTYFDKLTQTTHLLQKHQADLSHFFTKDKKGKLLPDYLTKLSKVIHQHHEKNQLELKNINTSIIHINEILDMQQSFTGISGVLEKVLIPDVVDLALQMSSLNTNSQLIKAHKKLNEMPVILTDRSKLLQILINLIRNAKSAVSELPSNTNKMIELIGRSSDNQIQITVKDNGLGISSNDMNSIFSFGFTTKKDGHGFGLHGSALLAKELGGSIKAESKGKGHGASFTLTLPHRPDNSGRSYDG